MTTILLTNATTDPIANADTITTNTTNATTAMSDVFKFQ